MSTLYWKNVSGNGEVENVLNWFTDAAATTQALNVPWLDGVDTTYLGYDLRLADEETFGNCQIGYIDSSLSFGTGVTGTCYLGAVFNWATVNGGTFNDFFTNFSNGTINGGIFLGGIVNNESCNIYGGTFDNYYTSNYGFIYGGTFYGDNFENGGVVYGGTFYNIPFWCTSGASLNGGDFYGPVNIQWGDINDGNFYDVVSIISDNSAINGGIFYGDVNNGFLEGQGYFYPSINDGVFYGNIFNYWIINGGNFSGSYIVNNGYVWGGYFIFTEFDNNGTIEGGSYDCGNFYNNSYVYGGYFAGGGSVINNSYLNGGYYEVDFIINNGTAFYPYISSSVGEVDNNGYMEGTTCGSLAFNNAQGAQVINSRILGAFSDWSVQGCYFNATSTFVESEVNYTAVSDFAALQYPTPSTPPPDGGGRPAINIGQLLGLPPFIQI